MSARYDEPPFVEPRVWQALNEIRQTDGKICSVFDRGKTLLKFGRNRLVGTSYETVWAVGGDEALPTSNVIDTISSSNAGDTQEVVVEGHTLANDNFTFVVQTATLNGQNEVTLSTPLARCTRLFNNNTVDFAGDVYAYQSGQTVTNGVPQDQTETHIKVEGTLNENQSAKAATAISSTDYWIVTSISLGLIQKSAGFIDAEFQTCILGKTWRTRKQLAASANSGTQVLNLDPCLIVPANSDVRIRALADGAGRDVVANMNGYLAKVDRSV